MASRVSRSRALRRLADPLIESIHDVALLTGRNESSKPAEVYELTGAGPAGLHDRRTLASSSTSRSSREATIPRRCPRPGRAALPRLRRDARRDPTPVADDATPITCSRCLMHPRRSNALQNPRSRGQGTPRILRQAPPENAREKHRHLAGSEAGFNALRTTPPLAAARRGLLWSSAGRRPRGLRSTPAGQPVHAGAGTHCMDAP